MTLEMLWNESPTRMVRRDHHKKKKGKGGNRKNLWKKMTKNIFMVLEGERGKLLAADFCVFLLSHSLSLAHILIFRFFLYLSFLMPLSFIGRIPLPSS